MSRRAVSSKAALAAAFVVVAAATTIAYVAAGSTNDSNNAAKRDAPRSPIVADEGAIPPGYDVWRADIPFDKGLSSRIDDSFPPNPEEALPAAEGPVIVDISTQNQADACETWEESNGVDAPISDKPYDGTQSNFAVGFGGNGGGAFGGRTAARRRTGAARHGDDDQDARRGSAEYALPPEHVFIEPVGQKALSTFAIDVDTASYATVRGFFSRGDVPPKNAVRVEEVINAFTYRDAPPADDRPFVVRTQIGPCPWASEHRLLRVAVKGRVVAPAARPAANLVFLLDVSGSMAPANKLPLAIRAMKRLVDRLEARDTLAIVTYANGTGVALPPTRGDRKDEIHAALDRLQAGGSTNGEGGIRRAYELARRGYLGEGMDRVILCTDGDFNVGISDSDALVALIEKEAKSGVELTALGFGFDNIKDATLERLANRGNGNYGYVDDDREARKLLSDALTGAFVTIAKDVKIQVEFNPATVRAYRQIGYENRALAAKDFRDDKKDGGEIGAGHLVTALYEIVPVHVEIQSATPALRYQPSAPIPGRAARSRDGAAAANADDLCAVAVRWKRPLVEDVDEIETRVPFDVEATDVAAEDFRHAAAAATFGMLLRESPAAGGTTWRLVEELALASAKEAEARARSGDERDRVVAAERDEFLTLVRTALGLLRR